MRASRITAKGSAATVTRSCRPCRAFAPPTASITEDTPARATPQKMMIFRSGSGLPCWDMDAITSVAESADVMKKTASSTMIAMGVICANGRASRTRKSMSSGDAAPAMSTPSRCNQMAVPPKTENASTQITVGASSTTLTYWRRVRPREMRATNTPTNGAHETHHAQ